MNTSLSNKSQPREKKTGKLVWWVVILSLMCLAGLYWVTESDLFSSYGNNKSAGQRGSDEFVIEIYSQGGGARSPSIKLIPLSNQAASWRSVGPLQKSGCNERSFFSHLIGDGVTEIRQDAVALPPLSSYAGVYCFEATDQFGGRHYRGVRLTSERIHRGTAYSLPRGTSVVETRYDWGSTRPGGHKEEKLHRTHLDDHFLLDLRRTGDFLEATIHLPPKLVLDGHPDVNYQLEDSGLRYTTVQRPEDCRSRWFSRDDTSNPVIYGVQGDTARALIPLRRQNVGHHFCLNVKIKGVIGGWRGDTHPHKTFVDQTKITFAGKPNRQFGQRIPEHYQVATVADTYYDAGVTKGDGRHLYRQHLDEYFNLQFRHWQPSSSLQNTVLRFQKPPLLNSSRYLGGDTIISMQITRFEIKQLQVQSVSNPQTCRRNLFESTIQSPWLLNDSQFVTLPAATSSTQSYYCLKVNFKTSLRRLPDAHGYRIFLLPAR